MRSVLLLASDHLDKRSAAVRSLGPGIACALAAGEGPSTNPKHQPNEDSLGATETPTGFAAFVADAHWGAAIGEAIVRAAASSLAAYAPATPDALVRLVRELASQARAGRRPKDISETTFLVAVVRGSRVTWASVADSHLYRVTARGAERVNHDLPLFAGADLEQPLGRGMVVIEGGDLELGPGELVLLASDGIAHEMSGLFRDDLWRELSRPTPLEDRVRAIIERARRAPGGHDNVALVALAPDLAQRPEAR